MDCSVLVNSLGVSYNLSNGYCNVKELAAFGATGWTSFLPLPNNPNALPLGPNTLGRNNVSVKYCLTQRTQRNCNLELIPKIIWIALAANVKKVFCFSKNCLVMLKTNGANDYN